MVLSGHAYFIVILKDDDEEEEEEDRFYIALFSALEQTHCVRMCFYMSD